MSNTWAYCRISTPKQSIDRQIRNAKAFAPDCIVVQEIYTGTKFQGRELFQKMIQKVKPGDTIIFDSVSRMSRDAEEGYQTYMELYNKGIELVFLKERHIDTASYRESTEQLKKMMGQELPIEDGDLSTMIKAIMQALETYQMRMLERNIRLAFEQSEKEVKDLQQRTKEGIQTAIRNGKTPGIEKGRKLVTKKSIQAKEYIKKHSKAFGGELTNEQCWKLAGIWKTSFYKYKEEIEMEMGLKHQK